MRVAAPLYDAKKGLFGGGPFLVGGDKMAVMIERDLAPEEGALARRRDGFLRGGPGRALVEGHDDIRTEPVLDRDRFLGAEEEFAAIQVGAELDSRIGDLAELGEAEDLKTTAVGQDRLVPIHELVQSAEFLEDVHAGTQEEVVGIGQDDLGAHDIEIARGDGLDRGLGPDRHVLRCLDFPVAGGEDAATGLTGGIGLEELEHGRAISLYLSLNRSS